MHMQTARPSFETVKVNADIIGRVVNHQGAQVRISDVAESKHHIFIYTTNRKGERVTIRKMDRSRAALIKVLVEHGRDSF